MWQLYNYLVDKQAVVAHITGYSYMATTVAAKKSVILEGMNLEVSRI